MNRQNAGGLPEAAPPSPRRMSRDARKSRDQRERIFEAIAKVLTKSKSGGITMDSVASKIGSSKGTIYYYFKSKGDMFYQMQMHCYDLVEEAVFPIMEDHTIPPRERLERVVYTQMMVMCDHWQLWRAIWADIALREAPQELVRAISRRRGNYERRMTDLVAEVVAAEGWACIEPKTVTRIVTGLLHSISHWYKKGGGFSAEQVADLAVQCVFSGPFERKPASSLLANGRQPAAAPVEDGRGLPAVAGSPQVIRGGEIIDGLRHP